LLPPRPSVSTSYNNIGRQVQVNLGELVNGNDEKISMLPQLKITCEDSDEAHTATSLTEQNKDKYHWSFFCHEVGECNESSPSY